MSAGALAVLRAEVGRLRARLAVACEDAAEAYARASVAEMRAAEWQRVAEAAVFGGCPERWSEETREHAATVLLQASDDEADAIAAGDMGGNEDG